MFACALELESANGSQTAGTEDTCDTIGVLGAAAGVIASIEAAEAIKLLTGKSQLAGGGSSSSMSGWEINLCVWRAMRIIASYATFSVTWKAQPQ